MIAITQGDPAGVGLEVALKGFSPFPRRIHLGQTALYRETARMLGISQTIQEVSSLAEGEELSAEIFAVLPPPDPSPADLSPLITFGRPTPEQAKGTVDSIRFACQLAMAGEVEGVVTPPINKGVLHAAGYTYPGHTEMLAEFTGGSHPVMMLATQGLRVVPATIHQALAEVPHTLTQTLLEQVILITWQAMRRDFALQAPRITVTGLNPHAGEGGAFGQEDREMIAPVCQRLNAKLAGTIRGPLPADSLFHPQAREQYDVVICMYHDQALIPIKMLGFGRAVNLTLGLPIVRTSVDHGTAYDIAGQGIADPTSYQEAISVAGQIIKNRLIRPST
ncbi:MAG: 4-hydroxythreonine-4-phosphate dehydrogenase PdxA [Magnetococcales bacterium]|nr:4-hydroxythreonine-4-phosphate dehydrogenase PdxA [Magnetococcales bacterium]